MQLVIIGNSGSGKSTWARSLAAQHGLAHLDLDLVAWAEGVSPPTRRERSESVAALRTFASANPQGWVMEGCYGDLAATFAEDLDVELRWLDPDVEVCLAHCRARPFEPHKYATPEEQDANLPMLLDWVAGYETRRDHLSRWSHEQLYDVWRGARSRITREVPLS